MKEIKLDGLNLIDQTAGYYVGTPVDGLDTGVLSQTSYEKSGTDGVVVSGMYMRERRIIIQGAIRASCEEDLLEARRNLSTKMYPSRTTLGRLTPKTLYIKTDNDSEFIAYVYPQRLTMPYEYPTRCSFMLDLLAEDFRLYSNTLKQALATKSTGGWISVPFSVPFSFVGGVDGSVAVSHLGNVDTYPIVRFNGPLVNPRIKNDSTGLFFQANLSIDTGQYLEVDMLKKTALLNGSLNKLSTMTSNSQWVYLKPGENIFTLTSGNDTDTGNAVIAYRDAYMSL